MNLYLQMGHGMQSMILELVKMWNYGDVIISPVNIRQDKVEIFSKKIQAQGGKVLFDPQMFYPKEGHDKLREYDYWPNEGVSISSEDGMKRINSELFRINNLIGSDEIILPGTEMNEGTFEYGLKRIEESINYFRAKTEKALFATICLYPETIRDAQSIEYIVEQLKKLPLDGYYVIAHPSNGEYIVSDPLWTIGVMKLLTCLKLHNRKVIVGYCNHQSLMYALAKVDGIASGTYMNTRSFVPAKFKSPKDDDVKHKSTWYYLPSAFCEYKAISLDVAMRRGYLEKFIPHGEFFNEYSSMLFNGALPSSTNYNETNSFKHYLCCMKTQCDMLSLDSYQETYDAYEFMLNSAELQINELKKHGISGQNRDFSPGIEANRVAICANDEDYGLKLNLEWQS